MWYTVIMRLKKLTPDKIDRLRRQYTHAVPIKNIMAEFNICLATVRWHCRDLPRRQGGRPRRITDDSRYVYFCITARKLGLTIQELVDAYKVQRGRCGICKNKIRVRRGENRGTAYADHDHQTGKFREFLCSNCNSGLGKFMDNPVILAAAIAYLEKHRSKGPPKFIYIV